MRAGIRIAIVDDHPLFVRGLELLLPEVSSGRAADLLQPLPAAPDGWVVLPSDLLAAVMAQAPDPRRFAAPLSGEERDL
ncbi:hypothetical protein [Paractinoplanes hotanensis]|uniref:DNA-binding response regulator n=1 Tax=Paractinoplanes hotanensis TaxID=2906497 RepID=A0ABT0YBS9_9ACTN|nr:hypothetical protein [Actinoplanes hotanensis]MCM4083515.1 hypothetical protein [Actinoplanes hotanensis]